MKRWVFTVLMIVKAVIETLFFLLCLALGIAVALALLEKTPP